MSGKHRKSGGRTKRMAVVGVATATATALTVGAAPPPPKAKLEPVVVNKDVDLAAAFRPFTDPDQIPDLTGGLGTAAYDVSQQIADTLIRAVVENLNLSALGQAAGLDLQSILEKVPTALLEGVLGAVPINLVGVLGDTLGPILTPVLLGALTALGITDAGGNTTLVDLLGLLGLDLSDPLNLANLDIPGVKLITTGPPFTLLKMLGADLGWVPGLPNSVADAINNTTYLDIGLKGLLNTVIDKLVDNTGDPLNPIALALGAIVDGLPIDVDLVKVRVPIVAGFGLGAFAAGAAYDKVLAQLPFQPGGDKSTGSDPLLGSLTILPMVLLRNPGRANGGLFARLFPLAGLAGIDTVTPDTEVTHSGGIPILKTGLSLGGANLIPIKVDATVEYDLMSDFAAWPNPFSIANSLMGAALPTYLLRGIDTSNLTPQLLAQIQAALARATNLNEPLALNLYLTLPTNSLPLLEPLYLAADLTSILTLGAVPNPFGMLANAFAPAFTSLANLGYTDVVRNPDGTYTRTLDEAGVPTPFMSFPDVNWGLVPGDIINSLVKGFQKEFLSGNPTPGTPNAITGLLKLLTGVLGPLGGLGDILDGLPGLVTQQISPLAATALPAADSRMITLSTDPEGDASTGKHAAATDTPIPDDTGAAAKHAAEETDGTQEEDEGTDTTTKPADDTKDSSTSSTLTPKPKPSTTKNPVGTVVGGVTHEVAGVVGGVTGGVANGVAGVLKSLAPKKTTPKAATTDTESKSSTEKKADAA